MSAEFVELSQEVADAFDAEVMFVNDSHFTHPLDPQKNFRAGIWTTIATADSAYLESLDQMRSSLTSLKQILKRYAANGEYAWRDAPNKLKDEYREWQVVREDIRNAKHRRITLQFSATVIPHRADHRQNDLWKRYEELLPQREQKEKKSRQLRVRMCLLVMPR